MSARTRVSDCWSGTSTTCMNREYFSRPAKKMTFSSCPSAKRTRHSPKSNWTYSPGSPSKRTRGSASGGGRNRFTSADMALLLPV